MTPSSDADEKARVQFYQNEIAPILPPVLLDFHTHVWSSSNWKFKPWESDVKGGKYMVMVEEYCAETLLADARRCFPNREYRAVTFGWPMPAVDLEKDTRFVAEAARMRGLYPLMLAGRNLGAPREWIEQQVYGGNFVGYKVCLPWFGDDYGLVRVEDMLGPNEMGLANELRLVVLLHVPRSGRLTDPVVQEGVRNLAREYPNASIVLAHCGRCYLPSEIKKAVAAVRQLENVFMDTAMVMDSTTIQIVLEAMGPHRVLYGTDLPFAAMKGRRVRVMDHWVDVVLDGYRDSAYRARSGRIRATYMAAEIAVAIRDAAERVGISDMDRHAIFYGNGMRLLRHVMNGQQIAKVEENWIGKGEKETQ